jgi:hypothetical protein
MRTKEDEGGGGGGGKLEERDSSQEDRRRAPVQHFWERIKGAGWAFVGRGFACLSECLFWLAVGCRLLGVECWVLGVGCCALCWLWLSAVWLAGQDREAARERRRVGESASEQKERTGVGGADEGG